MPSVPSPRPSFRLPVQADIRLFRLFGIDFVANWSWALLVALLVWVAGDSFSVSAGPGLRPWVWPLALLAALLAVASLYGHELAHAAVARRFGIPVHSISLFLLGGAAHMTQESPTPRVEFLIAVAGPGTSLVIGLLGALAAALLGDAVPVVALLGSWLAVLNIPLAVFNMLPAYPLDGGRVLRAMLWFASQDIRWGSGVAARAGQAGAAALLFAGLYSLVTGIGSPVSGLWLVIIAWFLFGGSISAHRATLFRENLRQVQVASVMQRNLGRVDTGTTLRTFAEEHAPGPTTLRQPQTYGVSRDGDILGLVALHDLHRVPASAWDRVTVDEVMVPLATAPSLRPESAAMDALQLLLDGEQDLVPVVVEERLLGVVSRADLVRAGERP